MIRGVVFHNFPKILLLGILLSATFGVALSASAAERIEQFTTDLTLQADGSVLVSEEIVYDFGSDQRHGIFRELSTDHNQAASAWYKNRFVSYDVILVERNGVAEPFTQTGSSLINLRIGDPNKTITGTQTYTLSYVIQGAASQSTDGSTELYWNVTGDSWTVPMNQVVVTLRAGAGVQLLDQAACYVGTPGATSRCDVNVTDTQTTFTSGSVPSGSQVTIAQAYTSNQPPVFVESINWLPFALGSLLLFIVGAIYRAYRWVTHFKLDKPVIAQYEPYQDFKPMFTGVLFDGRLDSRDITAGIVYLAQQGFLKITHIGSKVFGIFNQSDYEVTLTKDVSEVPTDAHTSLLQLLFMGQFGTDHPSPSWRSLWVQPNIAKSMDMPVGKTVRLSDIKRNTTKLRENYKLIMLLKQAVKNDLHYLGFRETFILTRRTTKGYEALNYLKGFKEFLSVTESERYKFHNAPQKSPEQFMEFLPYAIAFGVEKEWAEAFKDISISAPDWYDGGGASFNAAAFSADMSNFSSSLASSGAGSGTGASGGGSAGGGGGGGGGGSW